MDHEKNLMVMSQDIQQTRRQIFDELTKIVDPVFGFKIAQDVRDNVYRLPGIEEVKVSVSNHFMADAINKQVNESKPPAKA